MWPNAAGFYVLIPSPYLHIQNSNVERSRLRPRLRGSTSPAFLNNDVSTPEGPEDAGVTHVLPVSGEMGKLHHLVAELAENLDEFLEGADSFQMVQGDQDLAGGKTASVGKVSSQEPGGAWLPSVVLY